jgi:hypothetical protein
MQICSCNIKLFTWFFLLLLPSPSTCSTVSNRTIFATGRSKIVDFVLTKTLRTSLSLLLRWTSTILPNGQPQRGELSSTRSTISPTAKFLRVLVHFCRSCRRGRYSFTQRSQKISARYWTCFHLRREWVSLLVNTPGGRGILSGAVTGDLEWGLRDL